MTAKGWRHQLIKFNSNVSVVVRVSGSLDLTLSVVGRRELVALAVGNNEIWCARSAIAPVLLAVISPILSLRFFGCLGLPLIS